MRSKKRRRPSRASPKRAKSGLPKKEFDDLLAETLAEMDRQTIACLRGILPKETRGQTDEELLAELRAVRDETESSPRSADRRRPKRKARRGAPRSAR
jgi:hypothetical protein